MLRVIYWGCVPREGLAVASWAEAGWEARGGGLCVAGPAGRVLGAHTCGGRRGHAVLLGV